MVASRSGWNPPTTAESLGDSMKCCKVLYKCSANAMCIVGIGIMNRPIFCYMSCQYVRIKMYLNHSGSACHVDVLVESWT